MGEAIRIGIGSESCANQLVDDFVETMALVTGSFEVREARALELGNELVRRWIERELQSMAQQFDEEVVVNGERYRRHDQGARRYHTLCGPVVVQRESYRLIGIHNAPTVVPLELRAGLVENATPALAFSVTQGFAERPLRHYEVEMRAAHRYAPSRSTLERIGKRVGEAIQTMVVDVEPAIREAEPVVENVCSLSFGLDRTTVPMAELIEDAPRREPRIRRAPAPITVAYRMAYVGTVSAHNEEGRVLVTKRFAATPSEGADELVDRIGGELRHLQARHGRVPLTVVQDGAPELWNLVGALCDRHDLVPKHEIIDRFHVDERLAEVCELVTNCQRSAWDLREAWGTYLDRSDTAIDRIIRRLDELFWHIEFGHSDEEPTPAFWRTRSLRHISSEKHRIVSGHLEYFRNHRHRMRYATSRRRGLPIGSGPTEGACKSVVTMRFKRSGQRWFESGLSPCLSLRALHLSERLRPCFARLQAARFASLEAA